MSVRAALLAANVPAAIAAKEAPRAEAAMREAGITTQRRATFFLAQVLHESLRLRYFEEIADGSAYEGRCSDLGNCQPGDGRRYKGRGPIQLTGRANYRAAGRDLGLPLEDRPTLAARHAIGWRIAGWYWKIRGLNALADRGDFVGVTRRINGGTNGLADRRACLATVRRHDCRPVSGPASWLREDELRWVRELDGLRRSGRDVGRQRVLVRVLTERRKHIWRNAQPKAKGGDGRGWAYANRRKRYESIRARTT